MINYLYYNDTSYRQCRMFTSADHPSCESKTFPSGISFKSAVYTPTLSKQLRTAWLNLS